MDIARELVGQSVIVEWYREVDAWIYFTITGVDPGSEWFKLEGEKDDDGHARDGRPIYVPFSEVASLTLRTRSRSNGVHHGKI